MLDSLYKVDILYIIFKLSRTKFFMGFIFFSESQTIYDFMQKGYSHKQPLKGIWFAMILAMITLTKIP